MRTGGLVVGTSSESGDEPTSSRAGVLALLALIAAFVVLAFRYVSLGSIVTAAAIPVLFRYLAVDAPFWRIVMSIAIAIAVILKHHSNISRLVLGTEGKLGQKKES